MKRAMSAVVALAALLTSAQISGALGAERPTLPPLPTGMSVMSGLWFSLPAAPTMVLVRVLGFVDASGAPCKPESDLIFTEAPADTSATSFRQSGVVPSLARPELQFSPVNRPGTWWVIYTCVGEPSTYLSKTQFTILTEGASAEPGPETEPPFETPAVTSMDPRESSSGSMSLAVALLVLVGAGLGVAGLLLRVRSREIPRKD